MSYSLENPHVDLDSHILDPALVTSEVQSVKVDGTGGTFQLIYEGDKTAKVAFNVSAAALKTALEDLPGIPNGAITVTGGPGNSGGTTPYLVTFGGDLAEQDIDLLGDEDELTGGGADVTVTVVTAGGAATKAVQRGEAPLADRTAIENPLLGKSPVAYRAEHASDFGD